MVKQVPIRKAIVRAERGPSYRTIIMAKERPPCKDMVKAVRVPF
jgi:hypothetical protein